MPASQVALGACSEASAVVGDVTPDEEQVELAFKVCRTLKAREGGALAVQVWRRSEHAVQLAEAAADMVGGTMWAWDELLECGQQGRVVEGWFACDDGCFDHRGCPVPGTRQVCLY